MMKIGILQKGDKVLSITHDFIAVQKKNGEVDIVPLVKDETGLRVDIENIVTIGYGNNTVQVRVNDDVVVTTF
jgi:activator of 2-hydroxyglutaryl-CoA dehydratase